MINEHFANKQHQVQKIRKNMDQINIIRPFVKRKYLNTIKAKQNTVTKFKFINKIKKKFWFEASN